MAHYTIERTALEGRGGSGLLEWLKNVYRGAQEGFAAYRTYQKLDALTDRQLAQMGLQRNEIGYFAMFGRRGWNDPAR